MNELHEIHEFSKERTKVQNLYFLEISSKNNIEQKNIPKL